MTLFGDNDIPLVPEDELYILIRDYNASKYIVDFLMLRIMLHGQKVINIMAFLFQIQMLMIILT